jgi:hypothetical protein
MVKFAENHYLKTAVSSSPRPASHFSVWAVAWEHYYRLSLSEADNYLGVRRQQGFNVIQAVIVAGQIG